MARGLSNPRVYGRGPGKVWSKTNRLQQIERYRPYAFVPDNANATEVWRMDEPSGSLLAQIDSSNNLTASGTPLYKQKAPLGTAGSITFDGSTDYFTAASPSIDYDTNDFAIEMAVKHTGTGTEVFFDHDSVVGTQEGIIASIDATNLTFIIHDGSNAHQVQFAHSGLVYNESAWRQLRFEADRSATKAKIFVDRDDKTTTQTGNNLSTLGACSPAGGFRLGAREDTGALLLTGSVAYLAIWIGSSALTYGVPLWDGVDG